MEDNQGLMGILISLHRTFHGSPLPKGNKVPSLTGLPCASGASCWTSHYFSLPLCHLSSWAVLHPMTAACSNCSSLFMELPPSLSCAGTHSSHGARKIRSGVKSDPAQSPETVPSLLHQSRVQPVAPAHCCLHLLTALAILPTCHAYSHLRTFALAVPCLQYILSSDVCITPSVYFLQSSDHRSLAQRPSLTTLFYPFPVPLLFIALTTLTLNYTIHVFVTRT